MLNDIAFILYNIKARLWFNEHRRGLCVQKTVHNYIRYVFRLPFGDPLKIY